MINSTSFESIISEECFILLHFIFTSVAFLFSFDSVYLVAFHLLMLWKDCYKVLNELLCRAFSLAKDVRCNLSLTVHMCYVVSVQPGNTN